MSETPKRFGLGPRIIRESSIGPVDAWLEKRAEWMIEAAGVQKHLAPKLNLKTSLQEKWKKVYVFC